MDASKIDPNVWVDAGLRFLAGGGWVVPALLALLILAWAYRGRAKKGD